MGIHADPELEDVFHELVERSGGDPRAVIGAAIRQSIDEVLDGPRTGRWGFEQLEKTEKTYVGTKLEIVLRTVLDVERGSTLDLGIAGVEVDLKWAMASAWQIPMEAINHLCLCVGGLAAVTQFQAGVVRCRPEFLNPGQNRDRKRTLSVVGRTAMKMLVLPTDIPPNFVAEMDPEVRSDVMSGTTIQERVTGLFQHLPYTAIPRTAVATVARTTGDPMRRVRVDRHADSPLGDLRVLSSKYGNKVLRALGRPTMPPDHFIAVRQRDLDQLPPETRMKLGLE